jgi:glucosyl-3-phosphoglycerate synthase
MKRPETWVPAVRRWLWAVLETWLDRNVREAASEPERKALPPTLPLALDAKAYATVIIPALNEAKRIADVVTYALADPATADVIVIDDSSVDATAQLARQAGARVILSSMLGKGASMQDGIEPAQRDLLVYLDGDLAGLRPGIITDLCAPLLRGHADFVKARFGRSGGRVTELTAKPMLKIFFPELAHLGQPLGGIIAARKSLLQALPFEDGYGVDVGVLIDAHLAGARIAEVDIGSLEHDSQPLHDLTAMANEVSHVIFSRARAAGRMHVEQVATMYEAQRQATASIDYVLTRRKGRQRLLFLDMDGTVTPSRYAAELARANGQSVAFMRLLDAYGDDAATRSENIAKLFQYLHKRKFQQVARIMEIRPGVIEFVNQMRRRGFMVGVVSDSYFVAADIIRKRIFADFAMAHSMVFENDVCTGQMRINPAFTHPSSPGGNQVCKSNVLRRFLADASEPTVNLTWVVGDNINDLAIMRLADAAFAIEPKSPALMNDPGITVVDSFVTLLNRLPNHTLVEKGEG